MKKIKIENKKVLLELTFLEFLTLNETLKDINDNLKYHKSINKYITEDGFFLKFDISTKHTLNRICNKL